MAEPEAGEGREELPEEEESTPRETEGEAPGIPELKEERKPDVRPQEKKGGPAPGMKTPEAPPGKPAKEPGAGPKPKAAPVTKIAPEPVKTEEKPEAEERAPVPEREAERPAPGAKTPRGKEEAAKPPEAAKRDGKKPKERVKLGIVSAVKSIVTREVRIEEGDVREMLESLELELLEADVDMAVASYIREALAAKLIGTKVGKGELHSFVGRTIRETLVEILSNERSFGIPEFVAGHEKPVKIMFLGINGAGKTTTIAKVARMLLDHDKKIVFAAADTFRAAAIEQMGVHAERLGVRVIKRDYGSDPASVAYDAVNYAKAHGIDAVLIDTAGRQDTNISLMNEMKKMDRVISPDIKVYIGESIAGNAIIEQINAFNREIGLDAVILTKLDCDPKGGTMLSISKATGIPIIYVGVGQGYSDLERFEPERIAGRIVD